MGAYGTSILALQVWKGMGGSLGHVFISVLHGSSHLVPLAIEAAWESNLWPMEHSTGYFAKPTSVQLSTMDYKTTEETVWF